MDPNIETHAPIGRVAGKPPFHNNLSSLLSCSNNICPPPLLVCLNGNHRTAPLFRRRCSIRRRSRIYRTDMEDDVPNVNNRPPRQALTTTDSVTTNKRRHGGAFSFAAGEEALAGGETNGDYREDQNNDSFEGGDSEVWKAFKSNFQEVQTVLDRNRALIQQVNANHQSKIHENLVENVNLIQEINGNISKVVALYSDLSTNFSSAFNNQHKATTTQDQSNAEKADR